MSDPRLSGFNDPQYQRDVAAFNASLHDFDIAYNAKAIGLALKGLIPEDQLPQELRDALALARKHESDVDGMDLPVQLRPFVAIVKALLLIL